MRLFVYSRTKEARQAPDIIVSIDPGLKTTGIAILNKVNATVSMSAFEWPDINIAKTYLPDLILHIRYTVRQVIKDIIKKFKETIDCIIEFPHITGEYAVGMSIVCVTWLHELFRVRTVRNVIFIQNKVPEFFMRKRSVTSLETVYYVRETLPRFVPPKEVATHAYDALLYLLFVCFDWFSAFIKEGTVRKPVPEIVSLTWK